MTDIVAAHHWRTNAELIAEAVAPLYIKPSDAIIDLTYGGGKWWTDFQHVGPFIANIETEPWEDPPPIPGSGGWVRLDYTNTRLPDALFDVVAFDPPYVAMGGRATSGMQDFMDRYGLRNAAVTPELLQAYNNAGLAEAYRICKPGGIVLAKCAPYISSAVRKEGDWWTRDFALELGFTIEDAFIHEGHVRAQPKTSGCRSCASSGEKDGEPCRKCSGTGQSKPRQQRHARNNYSVLWVLRKPKNRKK